MRHFALSYGHELNQANLSFEFGPTFFHASPGLSVGGSDAPAIPAASNRVRRLAGIETLSLDSAPLRTSPIPHVLQKQETIRRRCPRRKGEDCKLNRFCSDQIRGRASLLSKSCPIPTFGMRGCRQNARLDGSATGTAGPAHTAGARSSRYLALAAPDPVGAPDRSCMLVPIDERLGIAVVMSGVPSPLIKGTLLVAY